MHRSLLSILKDEDELITDIQASQIGISTLKKMIAKEDEHTKEDFQMLKRRLGAEQSRLINLQNDYEEVWAELSDRLEEFVKRR